ncbi:MAG: hypothetical protein IV094_04295 [Vitreoscilla sp.]|nr:hypothetical protein [Vitreoscilla sp.]
MSKTLTRTLALLGTLVALSAATLDASAATIRVKCETRTGRSSASIDGAALAAGTYSAVLTSGTHTARSLVANSVAGEVGFDFDSNPKDIRQGATPIATNFIVGGRATGKLLNSRGTVVAQQTVACRAN